MHHKSLAPSSYHQSQNYRENRPPMYNAEDYVAGLKRFCKLTGLQLYLNNNVAHNTTAGHEQMNGVMGNYANDNTNNTNYQNGGDFGNDAKHSNLNGGSSVSSNNKKNKKQKGQNNLQSNGNNNVNGSSVGTDYGNHGINGNYNGSLDNLTLPGNGTTTNNNTGGGGEMVCNTIPTHMYYV